MSDMRLADKRIRCYTSGDEIKFIEDICEEDKPEFHDISERQLFNLFKGLVVNDEPDDAEECDVPDDLKSALTYEPYNAEWYKMKFDGFPDEVYDILADVDKKLNKE